MARLEAEDKRLSEELEQVTKRQLPLDDKTTAAARFLSTWTRVGDLLDEVTEEEKQQILQHSVEVIEFRETDPSGKVGVYALQLFPEVRQYFRPDDRDGDADFAGPPRSPKTPNGAAFPEERNPAQLTEDAAVCTDVHLAPRVRHSSNREFETNLGESR